MWATGTLLNLLTVLAGGLVGTLLGDRLTVRLRENVVAGVGLFVAVMGVKFAIDTASLLYLLGAILIGGIIGSLAGIERRLNELGAAVQRRFATPGGTRNQTIAEAFVTASIVFCVGPLTFLGAIRNGLTGDASLLAIKSVLDGFTAIAFAATLGWGVLLSLAVILVYQGGLAAGASIFASLLSDAQLREMNATGGLLLVGVGLKLLRLRDVQVADYLPAIVVAPLLVAIATAIGGGVPK
ncbi:MAG TPA: DUF554 domain-containing protein [Candidatus Limnocylindria bacterium]|jgi:uncharacterized membrane protein YqgA involved in biofilm formation